MPQDHRHGFIHRPTRHDRVCRSIGVILGLVAIVIRLMPGAVLAGVHDFAVAFRDAHVGYMLAAPVAIIIVFLAVGFLTDQTLRWRWGVLACEAIVKTTIWFLVVSGGFEILRCLWNLVL